MEKPIIDPSTLSEEQRDAILKVYEYLKTVRIYSARFQGYYEALTWLFGEDFFKKGK